MTPVRYTLTLMRAVLIAMWCATAWAGGAALGDARLQVDPVLLVLSVVLSLLMGGTTLLIRVNALLMSEDGKEEPRPLVRPWLFAGAHMAGAFMGGLAMFIVSRMQSMDPWMSLLLVLLASFGGSKTLEILAERYLPVVRPPAV